MPVSPISTPTPSPKTMTSGSMAPTVVAPARRRLGSRRPRRERGVTRTMQSRRQFLFRAGAAGAAILAPQALRLAPAGAAKPRPVLGSGSFAEGVASGDPGARAMTLWTRVGGVEQRGGVRLEVARDKGFRHVVAREKITTGPELAGSVKARVTGLKPYEEYFYRFETKRTESAVGRFRTAPPADSRQPLTFAFFSCQDYTHGFYNAHDVMAREDLDFVVCLGDYIYAETYHTLAGGTAVRDDTIGAPGYSADVTRMAVDARRLPRQVRALPPRRVAAQAAREGADGRDLGRPRGPGQLRRGRARRRAPAGAGLHDRAPRGRATRRGSSRCRRSPASATGSTASCASARRSTSSCSTSAATAPTSRATTPSCRAAPTSASRGRSSATSRCAGSSASSTAPRPRGR